MQGFLESVNSVIWGLPMLIFFLFTALRFTFKSRFFQIRGFSEMLKSTLGTILKKNNEDGVSQFGAFCSVLGACIGTGNIVGVATAIYSGGPGTVFWMWVSAILSMMTAYSENYLGIKYKRKDKYGNISGGAFSYIENGLKMKGLAKIYSFFCIGSVIGMGNLTQSNSISQSLKAGFNVPEIVTAIIVTLLVFIIIKGGIKRIADFGTIVVPLMTTFYLIISLWVIFKHREAIIPCFINIFKEAFSFKAVNGYGIYKAVRFGISRGVFSNEAGLGSSTILHSQVENVSGEKQGMWAMLEVFIDTVFLCTFTAIAILVSTDYTALFGAELSIKAYSTIGTIGEKGIALLTTVFAFTSLTSCSFYGEKGVEYLFGKKHVGLYKFLYGVFSFIGCINPPKIIWTFADICNGLMAVPNLFAINVLGKEIEYK
ncbi:MAG: sodium:alanine symporter family protein [Clostridia bacterium]|nr:sodium:alanine symporter family protein [Clostridia bacterium]